MKEWIIKMCSDINKRKLYQWLIFVVIVMLFWGTFFRLNYNNDTYYSVIRGWEDRAWDMLSRNGRIFAAMTYAFFSIINVSFSVGYQISFFLGVIFLATALYVNYNLFERYMAKFWAFVLSMIIIMNPLSVDFFHAEVSQFNLGIVFSVLGTCTLIKWIEEENVLDLLKTFVFIFFSAFSYQSIPGLFIMISMPFLVKCANYKFGKFVKNNVIVIALYGVANALVLVIMTLLGSNKIVGVEKDWGQALQIAKFALNIAWKQNFGFFTEFPINTPFYLIIGIVIVSLLSIILHEKQKITQAIWKVLSLIYIFVGAYLLQLVLLMVGYGRPRICYPIGALFGVLILNYILNIIGENKRDKSLLGVIGCVVILYIGSEYFCFQNTIIDRYTTNARDKYTIEIIGSMISDYELQSGYRVEEVTFYKDAQVNRGYADVKFVQDIQTRAFFDWYSDIYSLNHFLETNYQVGEVNKAYEEYFSGRDWDTFSTEQIIFTGNELHICMY